MEQNTGLVGSILENWSNYIEICVSFVAHLAFRMTFAIWSQLSPQTKFYRENRNFLNFNFHINWSHIDQQVWSPGTRISEENRKLIFSQRGSKHRRQRTNRKLFSNGFLIADFEYRIWFQIRPRLGPQNPNFISEKDNNSLGFRKSTKISK